MGHLIDDLLELSRITRKPFVTTRTNLTEIASQIAATLSASEPGRVVQWKIARELFEDADEGLVTSALENLLNNAFKFTSKKPTATIEVGQTTDADGERCFFVKDDGAGFDMTYVDRLFGAFQRLHGLKDYEGSGIGLATVQRIVRRHGGRIWATAVVDGGATFYFTLHPPRAHHT
jgi:light-regulated signal transduction histidine kinase (bacteriophytochrome)